MHFELVSYQATAPGSSGAAAAAITVSGGASDSLVIKNNMGNKYPQILANWAFNQTSGWHQIVFPSGHDTTRNYRVNATATELDPRLPAGMTLDPTAQEQLSVTIAGSATAGDVELGCLLMYYPDLPGLRGRYIDAATVMKASECLTTISATLTGAATGYTGVELINAESDLLKANRDYAVLGFSTNTDCAAIFIVGPDTGYQRMAAPGDSADVENGANWFMQMSRFHGLPCVPVINSGNKNSTSFGFLQNENNVSPLITCFLALLKK